MFHDSVTLFKSQILIFLIGGEDYSPEYDLAQNQRIV